MSVIIPVPGIAAATWQSGVAAEASLPASGNALYDVRASLSDEALYLWNGSAWIELTGGGGGGGVDTVGAFGSSPNTGAASISGTTITMQPADATRPGGISTTTQSLLGAKTFLTSAISPIFASSSSNAASTGIIRLANTDIISWRNAANSVNRTLSVDTNNFLAYSGAAAGNTCDIAPIHTDNANAGSSARIRPTVGGASGGDPYTDYVITGVASWATGVDNSDSDSYVVSYNGAPGTNNVLKATTGLAVQFPQLTATTVPYLDASKAIVSSAVTPTELGYVSGVTSAIQTQIGTKAPSTSPTFATSARFSYGTATTVPYWDANKDLVSSAVTPTELGYVSGVTSAIQTQFTAKAPLDAPTFTTRISIPSGTYPSTPGLRFSADTDTGFLLDSGYTYLTVDGIPAMYLRYNDMAFGQAAASSPFYFLALTGSLASFGGTNNLAVAVRFRAGKTASPNHKWAIMPGRLSVNTTAVGNVGTGEDDLMTYSVVADLLGTNNDTLVVSFFGTLAATIDTKTIKVKFGGTTVLDCGAALINSGSFSGEMTVVRTGAATQIASATVRFSDGTVKQGYAAPTETLSGAVTLKLTGEATTTDDISQKFMGVSFTPAP